VEGGSCRSLVLLACPSSRIVTLMGYIASGLVIRPSQADRINERERGRGRGWGGGACRLFAQRLPVLVSNCSALAIFGWVRVWSREGVDDGNRRGCGRRQKRARTLVTPVKLRPRLELEPSISGIISANSDNKAVDLRGWRWADPVR
jgi:hypothetical protein